MSAPYPWLAADWAALTRALDDGKLGHAYLLSGRQGLGKFAFASAFAGLALCETPGRDGACGSCRGCTLVAAGNHPDLKIVTPDEERTRIVIEQVRDVIEFYTLKPHYRAAKVCVICPAELMNHSAANALLKILEEPPPGALLLLVTHRPGQLAATINSRCQKLPLREPDWPTCLAWLNAQSAVRSAGAALEDMTLAGAPLDILAQVSSDEGQRFDDLIAALAGIAARRQGVLDSARAFGGGDIRRVLDAVEMLVQALLLRHAGHDLRHLSVPERQHRQLQEIADKLNSKRLFFFLDQIASARAVVLRSSGVRGAEIVENLFFCWAKITQSETKV